MKRFLVGVTVLLGSTVIGQAAFWKGDLPGGTYVVSLPTISSVSTHEYLVDGVVRVTELTVATSSSVVARFYYLEPLTTQSPIGLGQSIIDKVQEKMEEGAARAGVEPPWKKVVKNYPTSTHAHTVEYRVESLEQIKKLFNSLESAWRNNRETTLKIEATQQ
jgi:hypothetical protein